MFVCVSVFFFCICFCICKESLFDFAVKSPQVKVVVIGLTQHLIASSVFVFVFLFVLIFVFVKRAESQCDLP